MNKVGITCVILCAMFASVLLPKSTFAQKPKDHQKTYYQSEDGKLYWNRFLPFYLSISPSPNKKGIVLESKVTKQFANPAYFDTEGLNYIRTKYAVDTITLKVVGPPIEIKWEVYADGEAPITKHSLDSAIVHRSQNTTYYGQNLHLSLKSTDVTSGVKETYISVNKSAFKPYKGIEFLSAEGEYIVQYYAVDYVGNVNEVHTEKFISDHTAPSTQLHKKGNYQDDIFGKDTKLSFSNDDKLAGVKTLKYRIDDGEFRTFRPETTIPKNHLNDGDHTIEFYSSDYVGNEEKVKKETFYFDKLPPLLASDILGDRYYANGKVYFSGRSKLKLTSVDNKSGVNKTYFSIDEKKFKNYDGPFYLPSVSGEHIVRFYSVDKMGNSTQAKQSTHSSEYKYSVKKIYVDLTGPSTSYRYIGPKFKKRNKIYISPKTKIRLSGNDTESGLQSISYSLNNEKIERLYKNEFQISGNGKHRVEIFAYDYVNNRNKSDFFVMVDGDAPMITTTFSVPPFETKEDGTDVYPNYVDLFIAATDNIVGNNKVTISVNGGQFKNYDGPISGFKPHSVNTVTIVAADKLDNKATTELRFELE